MILIPFLMALGLGGGEESETLPRSLASEALRAELPVLSSLDIATELQEREAAGGGLPFGMNASLKGRFSFPLGLVDRDVAYSTVGGGATVIINGNVAWSDLFNAGWGATLCIDILFKGMGDGPSGSLRRQSTSGGAYVSLEHDEFTGSTINDDFGNSIRADDMNLTSMIVGMVVRQNMGQGAFGEGRFGLGAVHYTAIDGDFHFVGTPDFRGSLFEDTWTFAMELKMGGGIRFGPLGFTANIGGRLLLPPNNGANASFNSGPIWTFDIEIGVELGF